MRGVRGISEELDQIVERIPPEELFKVVNAALEITELDYSDDLDIRDAINRYRLNPTAARGLVKELIEKSKECDERYIDLEKEGRLAESRNTFNKMCILNGLVALFAASPLTPSVVDGLVYDLGHGASNTDLFAKQMIDVLS